MEDIPNEADASVISDTEVKWERDIVPGKELEYRKFIGQSLHIQNPDDVYSESVVPASRVAINPVPKPQRTFRYLTEHDAFTNYAKHANKRIGTRPPLPSYPPPELKKYENESLKGKSKRKSYEFEDAEGLHILLTPSSSEKVQNESAELLKSALYHAQSEENIYEDIMDPARESPYEDIKYLPVILLKNTPPWKPGALKRALRPPKVVLKIQEIFDAKRGKKRVRTQQPLGQDAAPSKGDYSDNESDTEDNQKGRRKRFVYVHSTLKRNPRYQTLEKDLIELQEQQLFELFVVVSLRKVSSKSGYTPEITQRFPNRDDHGHEQSRETEERLKAIPKFCFPDSKTWTTMTDFTSETFSFVLTGEDGGRWFGYCRKLLPCGKGKRLPEVYCIVSRLGCFTLFSKILDEVEKRRNISPALVYPFMRSVMEAPFPAPGRTITVKNFLPGSGNEVIELCRPTDSRLEHIDFECLFQCLSIHHLVQVFASLLLERRVIFVADKLSTLSKCAHAVVALLYPFTWQHTYIPVLPASMIDITCSPTPFIIGILSASLPELSELPIEEVLVVDLCANSFLQQISDEENILPHKLQAALVYILEQRNDILAQERNTEEVTLSTLVSEAFVRFLVEIVGHYSLHMSVNEKGVRTFQQEAFRKSHTSRSVRQFLELFMETQMFAGFIQDRELRKSRVRG
ncbi:DENN domain-containing protein 2C [Protopterus annectens]|uniref:DENN domain-containing protein 2C n=1 Tax=Protopterus annectens TaxID=7888 RepID=UPI001CFA318A|nr:DENN domain-containing protein 2C [Protopterus annectens]